MNKTQKRALEVLKKGKKLLSNKKNWCSGTLAKNKNKCEVSPRSKDAVTWCAIGGICKFTKEDSIIFQTARDFLEKASEKLFQTCDVAEINDYGMVDGIWLGKTSKPATRHKRVLKIYDEAIKLAKEPPENKQVQYDDNDDLGFNFWF